MHQFIQSSTYIRTTGSIDRMNILLLHKLFVSLIRQLTDSLFILIHQFIISRIDHITNHQIFSSSQHLADQFIPIDSSHWFIIHALRQCFVTSNNQLVESTYDQLVRWFTSSFIHRFIKRSNHQFIKLWMVIPPVRWFVEVFIEPINFKWTSSYDAAHGRSCLNKMKYQGWLISPWCRMV